MKEKPSQTWLSIQAYGRTFGVTAHTVYKWLEAGLLESYRVGRCVRIKNQPPQSNRLDKPCQ